MVKTIIYRRLSIADADDIIDLVLPGRKKGVGKHDNLKQNIHKIIGRSIVVKRKEGKIVKADLSTKKF